MGKATKKKSVFKKKGAGRKRGGGSDKKIPDRLLLRSEVIDTFFANTFEYDQYGRLVVVDQQFQAKIELLMAQGHTVYITVASPVYIVDDGKEYMQPMC